MSNFVRKTFFALGLGTLALNVNLLTADDCCEPVAQECCAPYNLRVAYTSRDGIGRRTGYTTLGGFYCPDQACVSPYADARLHFKDIGRTAGNFGLGLQQKFDNCCGPTKARGYIFYDFLNAKTKTFNQILLGAEAWSRWFDIHFNVYLPLKARGDYKWKGPLFRYEGGYKARARYTEYTWRGFELLFSRNVNCFLGLNVYTTLGFYSLHGHRQAAVGGKLRLDAPLYKGLTASLQTSYDGHFKGRTFGQISWIIPFGAGCCTADPCCLPVLRDELIYTSKRCSWKTNY
jgi:hypothetical protein